MQCSRCGNENADMFYEGERGWYCRRCIKFGDVVLPENNSKLIDSEYILEFTLTPQQKAVSGQLREYVENGQSVLLEAVCGAGKTEIIFETISAQLKAGKKVGFSIARRQVVIEIAERLKNAFPHIKVVAVCQGHTEVTMGDLVVCTTHQLYRYHDYFDLLIIDEPDAFPFKGNETLKGIARNACHGETVYLTATPDRELMNMVNEGKLAYLHLAKRPHGHPLCVPKVHYGPKGILLVIGLKWIIEQLKRHHKVLIFVPSKKLGKRVYRLARLFINCCHIDSESSDRDETINDFRNGKYPLCISTSVLERGVTIADVEVLVWMADNGVFDEASLTQIAGRVGRSIYAPDGECLLLCDKRRESIDDCVGRIMRANNE